MLKDSDSQAPTPLHEQVYRHLVQGLMKGIFEPGQRLSLRSLADELGTSVAPIREAVGRLAALNVLRVIPKRYILVPNVAPERFLEIAEIRKLLEGHAVAQACSKMTSREIKNVRAINDELMRFAAIGDLRRTIELNQNFHFAIYKTAGSMALLECIEQVWLKGGPSTNQLLAIEFDRDKESLQSGFHSHILLINALEARDSAGALAAITQDIDVSAQYLLDGLKRQSDTSATTLKLLSEIRIRPQTSE